MSCVAPFAVMFGEDVPDGVQFTVLAQQVSSAEVFGMDVPDSHRLVYWVNQRGY